MPTNVRSRPARARFATPKGSGAGLGSGSGRLAQSGAYSRGDSSTTTGSGWVSAVAISPAAEFGELGTATTRPGI